MIVEHDLVAALRGIPDRRAAGRPTKTSVNCQSCQAISVFDPEKVGQRCEFCGSSSLVPYEQVKDAFRPESLLPLKISEPNARDLIRAWYGRQWLAPNAFRMKALTDTVRAVYLPYWTFDAAGARRLDGRRRRLLLRAAGQAARAARALVSRGRLARSRLRRRAGLRVGGRVAVACCEKVEPFPTIELVPYDAGFVSGWTVERYQIDLVRPPRNRAAAWTPRSATAARRRSRATRTAICRSTPPTQVRRSSTSWRPVWLLTYTYGAPHYQVVVNGVTGRIAGSRPWSWIKIALLVLAILIVVLIIAAANN